MSVLYYLKECSKVEDKSAGVGPVDTFGIVIFRVQKQCHFYSSASTGDLGSTNFRICREVGSPPGLSKGDQSYGPVPSGRCSEARCDCPQDSECLICYFIFMFQNALKQKTGGFFSFAKMALWGSAGPRKLSAPWVQKVGVVQIAGLNILGFRYLQGFWE